MKIQDDRDVQDDREDRDDVKVQDGWDDRIDVKVQDDQEDRDDVKVQEDRDDVKVQDNWDDRIDVKVQDDRDAVKVQDDQNDRDVMDVQEKNVKDHNREYPAGIKWTRQRKDVYYVLEKAEYPLCAVQIYNRIEKKDDISYAVSTIYRILSAFEEKGLVTRSNWMGDGTAVYQLHAGGHTHYAVCLDCHKRIPLSCCPVDTVHLEEETGDFTVTGHKLELYGYCRECSHGKEPGGDGAKTR